MRIATRWVVFGLFTVLIAVVGCRKAPSKPDPVEIEGTVKTDTGKPLEMLLLRFHAQDDKNKSESSLTCVTKENGVFTGKCLPGKYKVTLSAVPIREGGTPGDAATTSLGTAGKSSVPIPPEYNSPTRTPLEVEITSASERDLSFTMRTR